MAPLEQTLTRSEKQTSDNRSQTRPGPGAAVTNQATGTQQALMQKISSFSVEFGPSRKDILNFTNQLSVMIKAGISLQEALDSIAAQIDKKKFKAIVADLKERIEAGQSFSQALGEYPEVFGSLYINMVAAAEISGSMSSMLQQLVEYLDQEAQTRSQVIGAMVYPVIIGVMAVSTTLFLLMFVLPRFLMVFAGKEHLLPAPTKIIMAVSGFLCGYWFAVLPAVCGVLCAFWYFTTTKIGKLWWDKAKLKIPLLKTLCRSLYITRSLHTMGVLTGAGVPILDTISITAQVSGNVLYERMWLTVYDAVRQGRKIVLTDVAEFYARELKTVIKMVTSMIEPIMIVLMGVLVGFIAMSIILPIFKMSRVVTS